MHESAATELFALARSVAAGLGHGELGGVVVGGGSDGNFTAAVGVQTLDGLGAVGGGAHGDSEHVIVATMPGRAALLAGLCQELSSMAKRPPLGNVPADR
jgi:glutamate carboxypeptidase